MPWTRLESDVSQGLSLESFSTANRSGCPMRPRRCPSGTLGAPRSSLWLPTTADPKDANSLSRTMPYLAGHDRNVRRHGRSDGTPPD